MLFVLPLHIRISFDDLHIIAHCRCGHNDLLSRRIPQPSAELVLQNFNSVECGYDQADNSENLRVGPCRQAGNSKEGKENRENPGFDAFPFIHGARSFSIEV